MRSATTSGCPAGPRAGRRPGLPRTPDWRPASRAAGSTRCFSTGEDVVLATPTASGKTLVYELPVLRAALAGEDARALFLFPLKALARDQRERLVADAAALGLDTDGLVEVYDGDTPTARRRRIGELDRRSPRR